MKPLLETIDTRFGTASKHAFSRGNTLPYTGVPFGMNYFVPQTSDQEGLLVFRSASAYLSGDSTNPPAQPLDWGLLLDPSDTCHRSTGWRQPLSPPVFLWYRKASFQPHYLKIFSLRYQIESQLTPTCYGASIRLEQKQGKALSLYLHAADELTVEQVDKRTLALRQEGKTETNKNPLILFTTPANEYGYPCYQPRRWRLANWLSR